VGKGFEMYTEGFHQAGSRGELTPLGRGRPGRLRGSLSIVLLVLLIVWLHAGGACGATDEDFSVAVLPDTQIYAWKFPELLSAQTRWIAENRAKYNIKYVLHVGDVVEHNNEREWKIAREAFSLLDGKVPYAIALGNHDIGPGGSSKTRDTLFGEYFLLEEIRKWESFGAVYDREPDKGENIYHVFRAGGRQWLALVLEFGPRDDVLRWAGEMVAQHPDWPVILITHAYLHNDVRRYDRETPDQDYPPQDYPIAGDRAGLNTGEDIWRKLVSKNRNMVMVISGHVCVAARLTSRGDAGNRVHQMVVDYQNQEHGGNGWLRLLQFSQGGRTVHVRDYSPVLDEWSDRPDRRFDLHLDLP
jgi:hypothetical protein